MRTTLGLPILGQDVVTLYINNMVAVVRAGQTSVGICCYLHHHLYLYSGYGRTFFKPPNIGKPCSLAEMPSDTSISKNVEI